MPYGFRSRGPVRAAGRATLDIPGGPSHTEVELQLSFKNGLNGSAATRKAALTLAELREGEEAMLDRIDLPERDAQRLMELGFLPGTLVTAARSSPFGDPRVFRVDGAEVALRRETAAHLFLRAPAPLRPELENERLS